MNEKLLDSLEKLSMALKSDPRYLELENKEKILSLNPRLRTLSSSLSDAVDIYNRMELLNGPEAEETKSALKKLHSIKLEMDSEDDSRAYLKAYSEVRKIYNAIDKELISPFRDGARKGCHHA